MKPSKRRPQTQSMGARVRFTAVAITSKDPEKFAQELAEKQNALIDDDWKIAGMIERDGALIISAQRVELPEVETSPVLSTMTHDPSHVEVTYYFYEDGKRKSAACISMMDAMTKVRQHLKEEVAVPDMIVVMQVSVHEVLKDLSLLEKMYPSSAGV